MDLWNMAFDALPQDRELVTVEQRLANANVLALLAIGQHLSRINEGESTLSEALVDLARHFESKADDTNWNE
jgi:hypothetical protein